MIPTNKEEDILFAKIKDKILKLMDKEFEKAGIDRMYYPIYLKIELLDFQLDKAGEVVLIDEITKYCAFCGKETRFYDSLMQRYMCSDCYSKIYKGEIK